MKPPVFGILILLLAKTPQRKLAHCGVFSVVGQALDYSEAWTAICAGIEKVFKSGVFGVAKFFEACVADGYVGRDD